MANTFTVAALQGETLDALCWRVLGQTGTIVEQALDLNRDLAEQGPILREGQIIILPILAAPVTPERQIVKLWD